MMPITLAEYGTEQTVVRIGGSPEVKKHLENLGFYIGGSVMVVNGLNGNLIIKVKDSRVAINKEMAMKIFV